MNREHKVRPLISYVTSMNFCCFDLYTAYWSKMSVFPCPKAMTVTLSHTKILSSPFQRGPRVVICTLSSTSQQVSLSFLPFITIPLFHLGFLLLCFPLTEGSIKIRCCCWENMTLYMHNLSDEIRLHLCLAQALQHNHDSWVWAKRQTNFRLDVYLITSTC